jgi:hypothetical protein
VTMLVSRLKKRWVVVGAAIAAFGGLFSILDILPKLVGGYDYAWTLSFIPDVLLVIGLALLAATACTRWGPRLLTSSVSLFRAGPWWKSASLVVLFITLVGAGATSVGDWKRFYRLRVFSAKFDWNYLKAKSALVRGDFSGAVEFFKGMRSKDAYLSKDMSSRRRAEQVDTLQRLADVQSYLARYRRAVAKGGVSMADLLMVQRAARLSPDSKDVLSATLDAQRRLTVAIETYFVGVNALQKGEFAMAQSALQESLQKSSISFFDQELLVRYCADRDLQHFSSSELELIKGYLNIPVDRLRYVLKDAHPWVSSLLAMPSSPMVEGSKQLNYYQQMLKRDHVNADVRGYHPYGPL